MRRHQPAFSLSVAESGMGECLGGRTVPERTNQPEWLSVAAPPPPYTIVLLAFDDGSVRRGVWNGKVWWGYDERVKRACELHPLRWRLWKETMPTITRLDAPHPRGRLGNHS